MIIPVFILTEKKILKKLMKRTLQRQVGLIVQKQFVDVHQMNKINGGFELGCRTEDETSLSSVPLVVR